MSPEKKNSEELLKDRRVVEEIRRHLWIESEKAGYDIGFEKAKEDWLKNFSKTWLEYHLPIEKLKEARLKENQEKESQKVEAASEAPANKAEETESFDRKNVKAVKLTSKRRRAKSYLR